MDISVLPEQKHSYFPYFHSVKYGKRYVSKVPDVRPRFGFPLLLLAPFCLLVATVAFRQFVVLLTLQMTI